ncbi:lipopolysaccharide biosynthesis protein [Paracoccus benzoatiresistens]|uniref:Lipopolysaccharide biosynthesis protein n=1 Tax=Paracoccus benzoatiresistens TaxID=2997341 RepID=A0ABT4J9Z7_9RHOB|nr:lipopolysaccharide biosynthesis protein [Paracoccus sp. EF6]MCZ0963952.1 lipopolysaccharide biosynthesis protein [Paracoccus sp. EF6]
MHPLGRRFRRSFPRSFEGLLGSLVVILSSNAAIAFLTLGTFALTSQALSPTGLGLLVLIEAYGRMFDQVLRLEPSQALIRMGMPHRDAAHDLPFRKLVKFGFLLDAGGSVLAAAVALACLPLLSTWFGFVAEVQPLVVLYCLTFLLPAPMTATALFRIFGRFGLYARVTVLSAVFRLAMTGILFLAGSGLEAFVFLLCAVSCMERLLPLLYCWPLLRQRVGPALMRTPLAGVTQEKGGLWRFILASNLNVLARNSTRQFDIAALGGFVTPAELSFYVLAKRFAMLVIRLGSPVQLVLYPRMCELMARHNLKQLLRFVFASSAVLLGIGACGVGLTALVGRPLVAFAFGPEFVAALPNILVQLAGACLFLTGKVFGSALQTVGRVGQLTAVSIITAAVFFVPIPFVVPHYGVIAASCLGLLVGVVFLGFCAMVFARAVGALRRDGTGPLPNVGRAFVEEQVS